jgi:hypothetical protein
MLNLPESVAIVRGFATARSRIQTRDSEVFWRAVLDYCLAGNLQAVLDEYVHVLRDWVGDDGNEGDEGVVDTAVEAIGVQASRCVSATGKARTRRQFNASLLYARHSTRRSGPSSSQQRRSGRRDSTSISTRTPSCTGTCPTTPSISSSEKDVFTASKTTPYDATSPHHSAR